MNAAQSVPPRDVDHHRGYAQSPVDVLRLVGGLILIAVGVGIANLFDSAFLGLALDGQSALSGLPDWVRDVPIAILAAGIVIAAVGAIGWSLLRTRFRRATFMLVAFAAAAGLSAIAGNLLQALVDPDVQDALVTTDLPLLRYRIDNGASPSDPLVAGAIAMLGVSTSFLSNTTVRRVGALLAFCVAVSVFAAAIPALGLITDIGIGITVASVVLLIGGRHDLAPQEWEIRSALQAIGLPADKLEPLSVDARGSTPWLSSGDHDSMFVKVLGRDERSADLLFRAYRWLRYRKTGDHRPFISLRRAVEHEALVALQARELGIPTPSILGVAEAGVDGMAVVYEALDGVSADQLDDISDDALESIWKMISSLHERRIAHRDLRLANIFVSPDGEPLLIDFGFSELAASDQLLGTDVAELLASTTPVVGAERAVAAAHRASGVVELERAFPWLTKSTLSTATREAVGKDGLKEIRSLLVDRCGIPEEDPVRIERLNPKTIFTVLTIALSIWFLAPQFADLGNIMDQVRDASIGWALVAAFASFITYVAATGSLLGALPVRLAFFPALTAQVASSFANRVTPAKVGGVATNIRYMQKQGVPLATGVTAVGLNAVAGVIIHVSLIVVFTFLASSDNSNSSLPLPSTGVLIVAVLIAFGIIGLSLAIPLTRKLINTHVVPQLKSGLGTILELSKQPAKLALLFGGSAVITLANMGAMMASLIAFGSTAPLPIVGLLFLTGSAVANAAPTPGGVGVAEAALIAAFSTVDEAQIVIPAVFLFRFVTFWLPILPGWISLDWMRRRDLI